MVCHCYCRSLTVCLLQRSLSLRLLCACSKMPGMGKLEPFDSDTNWDEYREQVELYFIANNVKEEKR